jgi:hypothetical protein
MRNLPRHVPLAQDELSPELKTTISRIALGVLVRAATNNNPTALESFLDIFEWVSFAHDELAATGELMRQAKQYERRRATGLQPWKTRQENELAEAALAKQPRTAIQ